MPKFVWVRDPDALQMLRALGVRRKDLQHAHVGFAPAPGKTVEAKAVPAAASFLTGFMWLRAAESAKNALKKWKKHDELQRSLRKAVESAQEREIALTGKHTVPHWAWSLVLSEDLSPEMRTLLDRIHHYTWKSPVYQGAFREGVVRSSVYRSVSLHSAPGSWWYPPKVWKRTRRWKTKTGTHIRTTVHTTPPRDMKPDLLASRAVKYGPKGSPYLVVPIALSQAHMRMAMGYYAAGSGLT